MDRRDSLEDSIIRYEGLLARSLRNWDDLSWLKPCERVRHARSLLEAHARYLTARLDHLNEELRRYS